MIKRLILSFLVCTIIGANLVAQPSFKVVKTFAVTGNGGWDYLTVGPANNWLYVSHGTQVNVINKKTGDAITVIENTTGVHGIAFDELHKKGFISNGKLNNVLVFDMNTNKAITQITTGQNPDAIIYEPFSKKIITCNGGSKNVSIIDPETNMLVSSVDVGGRPETAVSDDEGNLFINIEDKNEIAVMDMKTFKVIHHWSIAPGEDPTGLAIDKKSKRLFAGCEQLLMVIDTKTGKVIDKITIGKGCDGVAFDTESHDIFTANGADGTLSIIHEETPDKFTLLENLSTQKGARTLTLDEQSHIVYLPTASFEANAGNKRPGILPGTFEVLVVEGNK